MVRKKPAKDEGRSPERRAVPIEHVLRDPMCQARVEMSDEAVRAYAEALQAGNRKEEDKFPPLKCVWDGSSYIVYDGWHTLAAHEQAGKPVVEVEAIPGTLDDARWLCLSVNHRHGVQRTNEDKRRVVDLALTHPRAAKMSDHAIATHCGVSHVFVGKRRAELDAQTSSEGGLSGNGYQMREVQRGDQRYEMGVANINRERIYGGYDGDESLANADADAPTENAPDGPPVANADGERQAGEAAPAPPATGPCDQWGIPVQPHAAEAFKAGYAPGEDGRDPFQRIHHLFRLLSDELTALASSPAGAFLQDHCEWVQKGEGDPGRWKLANLDNALVAIMGCRPFVTVCPAESSRDGHPEGCKLCRGRRWLDRQTARSSLITPAVKERTQARHGVLPDDDGEAG
jgi:hypothetical protein